MMDDNTNTNPIIMNDSVGGGNTTMASPSFHFEKAAGWNDGHVVDDVHVDDNGSPHPPQVNNMITTTATTTNEGDKTAVSNDTPTRSGSRLIKKRRENGFFYAQDGKLNGTTDDSGDNNNLQTVTNDRLLQPMKQREYPTEEQFQTKKDTTVGALSSTDKDTTYSRRLPQTQQQRQQQQQQHEEDEGPLPKKNDLQKRSCSKRKCPTKDTILIHIPLSVTVDLGVAMKRTRKKRMKRIQRWIRTNTTATTTATNTASMMDGRKNNPNDLMYGKDDDLTKSLMTKNNNNGNSENDANILMGGIDGRRDEGEGRHVEDDNEDDDDNDDDDNDINGTIHKNQYTSIVDYLEAKYVRGVMINDYDETETRQKKKEKGNNNKSVHTKKKLKTTGEKNNCEGNNDEGEDSEREGSVYSSDGGFIDDSLLNEEVVEQIMASSTYGMTQIEEEARRRKFRGEKEKSIKDGIPTENSPHTFSNREDGSDNNDEDDESDAASAADSDFDDGFFVNVGDLEMAEGWSGDHDMIISPVKIKNKTKNKRAYNKTKTGTSSNTRKLDGKTVKKKVINSKIAPPGKNKKLIKVSNKTLSKDAKLGDAKPIHKKKKKSEEGGVTEKTKKSDAEGDSGCSNGGHVEKKKASPIPKSDALIVTETETKAKSLKLSIVTTDISSQSNSPQKEKTKKPMSKEKEKATQLRNAYRRRYNICVKLIKEMTNEELPKKSKTKNTMKVSVNIPADKEIGDELTFGNPNIPGQKLKVKIPKNADMEKRRFVVSIPTPKVTEPVETRDNNFSKVFREALFNYSNAFDEWCDAEGEHNESLPADKRKPFKPGAEKLKKFDDMANEFPKNLATPVDSSYLRKIAKQERSNRSRREKRKSAGTSAKASILADGSHVMIEEQQQHESELFVPHKGVDFPEITFDMKDFS